MASLKYICDTVNIINTNIITIKSVAKTSTKPGQILFVSLSRYRIDLADISYFFFELEMSC